MGIHNDANYDVIIVGAGPSGLSAAHELAEKNLKVCVLEAASFVGGKPISAFCYPLKPPPINEDSEAIKSYLASPPEENREVSCQLPIEHGFRVYPENYNNLMNIMRRIPTANGKDVSHCLTNSLHLAEHTQPTKQNTSWKNALLSKLENVFFGLSMYTPYILCTERSMKYDDVSIAKLFEITKAAFLETIRLHPGVVNILRLCKNDDNVSGTLIKKGDNVFVPASICHKLTKYWDNPEGFEPARFMKPLTPDQEILFLGFSHGPQGCIGRKFASLESTLFLAMLVKRFDLNLKPHTSLSLDKNLYFFFGRLNRDVTMRVQKIFE